MSRSTTWGRGVSALLLWAATAGPLAALDPRPFFYQTWWFAALCVASLALAVVIGVVLRRRAAAAERANRSKSELLATMSHEFRTPMNAILGLADVLLAGDLRSDHRRHVETIRTSGESLLTLLNEILDVSKSEAGALGLETVARCREASQQREVREPPAFDGALAARFPRRILVAEDNAINQRVLLLMLERFGYRADVAANGFEVLLALGHAAYDLVLMDVQMPGMDGLEATRRLRCERPPAGQPRIVALTAHARSEDRQACLAAGMDDFLTKPVRPEELCAVLAGGATVAPAAGDRGPVDAARLARLREMKRLDGGSVLADVVAGFLSEMPRRLDQIRQALKREDRMVVGHLAHSLQGSCLLIGALRLADECRALQERAAAGSLVLVREIFTAVEEESQRVAEALAPYRPAALSVEPVVGGPTQHAALDL